MTRRVGVLADTHVGEYLGSLPDRAMNVLDGCDLILHAGDLSVPSVLDELSSLAPTLAVAGDHDRLEGLVLPTSLVVTVAGQRIGLTHGRRAWPIDGAIVTSHVLAGRRLRFDAGLHRSLLRRVGRVDCLVYGHWHEPRAATVGGTLCLSPGAVCPWGSLEGGRRPRHGRRGLVDRSVQRFRRQLGPHAMRPTVAILEVGTTGVTPRWELLSPDDALGPGPVLEWPR